MIIINYVQVLEKKKLIKKMTVKSSNLPQEIYELPFDYKSMHPEDLLNLFKHFAPHSLKQKEAKLVFKELLTYLTQEEEQRIFESWESIHSDPGEFYSIMHDLLYKYSKDNDLES